MECGGAAPISVYDRLPALDFSRDVVEPSTDDSRLLVQRIPACGWSDLGTPERLGAASGRLAHARQSVDAPVGLLGRPDLGRVFLGPAMLAAP